jgi:group I intron endonuclease
MNPFGFIYCVTNKINGHKYIGQTTQSVKGRWAEHIKHAMRAGGFQLHAAIRKYGIDNFSVETLDLDFIRNQEELNRLEILCIEKFDTYRNGYNATLGGSGCAGLFRDEEFRRRQAEITIDRMRARQVKTAKGTRAALIKHNRTGRIPAKMRTIKPPSV